MIKQRQFLESKITYILSTPSTKLNSTLLSTFFSQIFTPDFYDLLNQLLYNKQLYYIRHAESPINEFFSNADNFGKPYFSQQSYYDPSITNKGYQQLTKIPILYFDIAYISPMTRTMQTFSNLNIRLRKKPVVTPLIREKTKTLAGVVGTSKQKIQSFYPNYKYDWSQSSKYWWRDDDSNDPYKGIVHQSMDSFKARIAFFLLCVLLEGSMNILIVSHMAFYTTICKSEYYEQPDNAKLFRLDKEKIMGLFRRIEKRVHKPKL